MTENEIPFPSQSKFTPNKVNPEQKDFILQQLAEGYKHEEVRVKLKKKHDLDVSLQTIDRYSSLEEPRILEKRRALANELDRIAATSKFIRLRKAIDQEDRLHGYKEETMESKSKERLLLDNLEQQRKETEGFKGILGMDPDNPFTAVQANLGDIERALKELRAKETAKKADETG